MLVRYKSHVTVSLRTMWIWICCIHFGFSYFKSWKHKLLIVFHIYLGVCVSSSQSSRIDCHTVQNNKWTIHRPTLTILSREYIWLTFDHGHIVCLCTYLSVSPSAWLILLQTGCVEGKELNHTPLPAAPCLLMMEPDGQNPIGTRPTSILPTLYITISSVSPHTPTTSTLSLPSTTLLHISRTHSPLLRLPFSPHHTIPRLIY